MSNVKWVCDECFSEMKVEKEDTDRNRIYCLSGSILLDGLNLK